MFFPVIDACFDPRDQFFQHPDLISCRGRVGKRITRKEPMMQSVLNMGLPQELARGVVQVSFQLQILAAKPIDADFIHGSWRWTKKG